MQCMQSDQQLRVEVEVDAQIINQDLVDHKITQNPLDHEEQIEGKMGLYVLSASKSDIFQGIVLSITIGTIKMNNHI